MSEEKTEVSQGQKKGQKIGQVLLGVFMTIAVGSFVFSDVASYLGGGGNNKNILTVGRKTITSEDIKQEQEKMAERFKGLPPELIAMQNLEDKAKQSLIEKALLAEYGHKIGLRAPESNLANIIDSFAFFKDETTGKFSSTKYKDFLKRTNMSEKQFLELLSDDVVRDMIVQKILLDIPVSPAVTKIMERYEHETRKITYAVLKPSDIKNIAPLEDFADNLKKYYEEHKSEFSRPETRNIEYVAFTKDTLSQQLKPSLEDVKAYYKKHKEFYSTPEKRKLLQLTFETEDKAKEIFAKLEKKENFIPSVTDLGFELENIELGYLTKNDVPVELADDIFSVQEGEFTPVLKNDFGYAIYFSEKVKPAKIKTLEEVSNEINDILLKRAFTEFRDRKFDIIDDDIAGGATIQELSEKYKIPLIAYDDITANGKDYKSQKTIIKNPEMIKSFFDTNDQKSVISLDINDDGFIFGKVVKIDTTRPLTFEEAKPFLASHDRDRKTVKAIGEVYEKIKLLQKEKDSSVSSIAMKIGAGEVQEKTFGRNVQEVDISPELTEKLFEANEGDLLISKYTPNQLDTIVIASLKEIIHKKPTEVETTAIDSSLSDTFRFEIYKKIISELKKEFDIGA